MERAPPPPPSAPPPPAPPPPPTPGTPGLGRVLREALQRAGEALGEDGGIRELLRRRRDSFQGPLKWLLFHRPVPPLIQDGPQCGLVALSMAGALLGPPRPQLGLGALLDAARSRGYTRHGEMFSAAQMAALAQELFPCQAELLQGGLGGPNQGRVLRHLLGGRPLLVPYDEDSNHTPCCRRGHKAHWALLNGVILAVPPQEPLGPRFRQDPEIPNVFHANFGEAASHLGGPEGVQEGSVGARGAGEGSRIGEGSHFWEGSLAEECSQSEAVPDLGQGSGFEEGCRFGAGSQPEDGSRFEEGSQPKSLPDLGRGSRFGVGSQADPLPDLGRGSHFGSGSLFGSGSQAEDVSHFGGGSLIEKGSQTEECSSRFEEGSEAEGMPDLGRESHFGKGSQAEGVLDLGRESSFGEGSSFGGVAEGSQIVQMPDLGRRSQPEDGSHFGSGSQPEDGSHFGEESLFEGGSRPDSLPDFESGSRFGSGVLVLALQGKSPRPQLWALGELGASNGQLGELSPRRWGGGFVLPPGGVREGLQGRAVLLHPLPTPPQ